MRLAKKHYREILHIELCDLKEDLDCLIDRTRSDMESGKITERVFLENSTLFKNEKLGVDKFIHLLEGHEAHHFDTLEELIEALKQAFREAAQKMALANAVVICVERKMEKVRKYVTQSA